MTHPHRLYVTTLEGHVAIRCQHAQCGYERVLDPVDVDRLMSMQALHQRSQEGK